MKTRIALTVLTLSSLVCSTGCESQRDEIDEIKPLKTIPADAVDRGEVQGMKVKIFFPKDPIKKDR